jgi:hypothetical protein
MWQHSLMTLSRFQHLPDIGTSAAFWASIATIWSASGAWFTFVAASLSNRQQTFEGICNLLDGMVEELELVRDWASGREGSQGYLASKPRMQWASERQDWFNPTRHIFTVNTPMLNAVTTSQYAERIGTIISPIVSLNQALRRLFESHADYRMLVHSEPQLYRSVFRKLANPPAVFTQDEQEYLNLVFEANLRMHVDVIGGADSPEHSLYRAFRTAEQAVRNLRRQLRSEPLPHWYWLLHIIAAYLAFNGLWQVLRWFKIL